MHYLLCRPILFTVLSQMMHQVYDGKKGNKQCMYVKLDV